MDRQRASGAKTSTVRRAGIAIILATLIASYGNSVEARGDHGFGRGDHGMHGAHLAGGRRNDAYAKAASNELDKLLNTKIKSICRGC